MPIADSKSELAQAIARAIPAGGGTVMTATRAADLTVYRVTTPATRMHAVYRPSLCVVAQGAKTAVLGRSRIPYDSQRFFFSALPVPALIETRAATLERPLLGLILELPPEELCRVQLELTELRISRRATEPPALFAGALDGPLADALRRLVECASDAARHRVLYSGALREVLFHLLTGPCGPRLHELTLGQSATRNIVAAARFIDANLAENVSVPTLARIAGMSLSAFFRRFREVTSLTPLQYAKRMRLHHARAAILGGAGVTEAAFAVGYASGSQFSRDFRALFGHAPSTLGKATRAASVRRGAQHQVDHGRGARAAVDSLT